MLKHYYPEVAAGGFTRFDSTIQFYTRISALLGKESVVLDFGAGRGRCSEDFCSFRKDLMTLRGRVEKVVGVDVDPVVETNPHVDEAFVLDQGQIPLPDASVDLIVADWVFEHIESPAAMSAEFDRVLRPGGWICARTPSQWSLLFLASRLVPNARHARVISLAQPNDRAAQDVFPTFYRLNTRRALAKSFNSRRWIDCSYTWSPEPGYYFGKGWLLRLFQIYQYLKAPLGGEVLLVFMKKRGAP